MVERALPPSSSGRSTPQLNSMNWLEKRLDKAASVGTPAATPRPCSTSTPRRCRSRRRRSRRGVAPMRPSCRTSISCRSPAKWARAPPACGARPGAVIVRDKRILSTGYNGAPRGVAHCEEGRAALRERLGIPASPAHGDHRGAARRTERHHPGSPRGVSVDGATIYVTHQPTITPAQMIINSVLRVVCADSYPDPLSAGILERPAVQYENWATACDSNDNEGGTMASDGKGGQCNPRAARFTGPGQAGRRPGRRPPTLKGKDGPRAHRSWLWPAPSRRSATDSPRTMPPTWVWRTRSPETA